MTPGRKFTLALLGLILLTAAGLLWAIGSRVRRNDNFEAARQLTGGDPYRGMAAIERYGCGACHTIPGVRNANALSGPPLTHMALRTYIAGVIENRPDNMVRWILNPPAVDSKTAMPNLLVTETDAKDIASYLYTLK